MTTRGRTPRGKAADPSHPRGADRRRVPAPAAARSVDRETDAAVAAHALARGDAPLPHRDRIAAAFGAYAVDGIRSTVGGLAAAAATQLGARAFTVGDRIGFRADPDLHLAAHEAAHVVQQQGGVQLAADGGADDRYERHADTVADAVVAGRSAERLLAAAPRGPATQVVQLDEDDLSLGFTEIQPFANREDYVARGELAPRAGSGPDAITVDLSSPTLVGLDSLATGQQLPASPTAQPLDLGMFGHPHPLPATLGTGTPAMSADQMLLRLTGLQAELGAIAARAGAEDSDVPGLMLGAQASVRLAAGRLAPAGAAVPELVLEGVSPIISTDPRELSRQIVRSEIVLDRVYEALAELASELQQEEVSGGAIARLAPAHAGASYDLPEIRGWFMDQRWQYFTVANHVLQARIVDDFNAADEAHGDLDKRLLDLKLAYYQSIEPATRSRSDASMTAELTAWARDVADDVAWLRETAPRLRAAREAGHPDTALEARFAHEARLVSLSIEALGEFDLMVTAYEALRSAFAIQGFEDIWAIWGRIDDMRAAARDGDCDYLELLLRKHQEDPKVREFYESIADKQAVGIALTMFSSLLVGLALGLIAGLAAWGASLAFMATVGLVVTGALGESWVVLGALFLARTGLMALVFTLMSRALGSAISGAAPTTGFWTEFLWNWGLFFVTEGVNTALKGTLKALGTIERMAVTFGTNFTVLQIYGLIRGSAEHGRFLTGDEVLQMTGQNLIMLVGMSVGMKPFEPMMASVEEAVAIRRFRAVYGGEFEAFAANRAKFEADVLQHLQDDPAGTDERTQQLRERGEQLKASLEDLVERVAADPGMDLPGVRREAAAMFRRASRMSLTELLRSSGLPATIELLPTGREGAYSFPRGRAEDVRAFFAADPSYDLAELPTDGDRVFEVTVPGKGRIQLVESPTTARVVVPLTDAELATARAEIAEDLAARDAAAGGTRGRAAYEITETPGQDLGTVGRAARRMAGGLAREGIRLDRLSLRGTSVAGTVEPNAALTGELRVTSGKAPITADVAIEVVPNIDVRASLAPFETSVHAGEAGYAKLTITANGRGGWDVLISLDGRLSSEADVQIQLRHELREAARILVELAKDPTLGEAYIEAQQSAGVFEPGTETTLTSHDRAAAAELADLFTELEPALRGLEEARREVVSGGGKRARARRDAGDIAQRRLDAALDSMGFTDPATRPAKIKALLDALDVKPDSPLGRYVSDYAARTDAAVSRRAALDRISADRAAVDATLGPELAAHVAQRVPAGAMDPLAQAVRAGNGHLAVDLIREHALGRLGDDALVRALASITEPAPLKEWDDDSITFEEFRASYRTRHPARRGNLDDAALRARYDAGKRYNPETDALSNPNRERTTFEQRKQAMAGTEARKRAAFAADPEKPRPSAEFDAELAELSKAGLTKDDVGALAKWSRLFGKLQELAGKFAGKIPTPRELLGQLGRDYTETGYRAFRHRLTDAMIDLVLGRGPGGKASRPQAEQARLMRELLGNELELFPDSASKGAFFNQYSVARFSDPDGEIYIVKQKGLRFDNPSKIRLERARDADGLIYVRGQRAKGGPPDGWYAFDGKAGESSDPAQLRDVNELMTEKGIMMGGKQRDGVIYWCENEANAQALTRRLDNIGASAKIHVAYLDEDGAVQWRR